MSVFLEVDIPVNLHQDQTVQWPKKKEKSPKSHISDPKNVAGHVKYWGPAQLEDCVRKEHFSVYKKKGEKKTSSVYQSIVKANLRTCVQQPNLSQNWVVQQDHDVKHIKQIYITMSEKYKNQPTEKLSH